MKLVKLSWCLVLASCFLFASCDDGDNGDGGGPTGGIKLPTKIISYDYYDGVTSDTLKLWYDNNNRISQMEELDEDSGTIIKFVYNANGQLTETNHYDKAALDVLTFKETYTYNADNVTYSYGSTYGGTLNVNPYSTISVNTTNRTVKVASSHTESSYYWENVYTIDSKGNIVKYQGYEKDGGDVLALENEYVYGYDNRVGVFSNVKLSTPWLFSSEWSSYWSVELNLVNNIVSSQETGGQKITASYSYDADGYPTQATVGGKVYFKYEYKTVE